MRLLLHICCGPCAITVIQRLKAQGHEVSGFFFNPNIQPLAEYLKRREGAAKACARLETPLIMADELPLAEQIWDTAWPGEAHENPAAERAANATLAAGPARLATAPEETPPAAGRTPPSPLPLPPATDPAPWLRAVAGREHERCSFCAHSRLAATAALAQRLGFEAFTTSLLYSRHQSHDEIRALGENIAATAGPGFYYEDFRPFWQEGIRLSKDWGLYRQQYCGCIFSEYERYSRDFERARA